MKSISYKKDKISDYSLTDTHLVIRSNKRFGEYITISIELNKLSTEDLDCLELFDKGTHYVNLISKKEGIKPVFVKLEANPVKINRKEPALSKYVEAPYEPITYINYPYYKIYTQLDGITTIVGMSGAGKTYSAVSMLPIYAELFTKIVYLNYELTQRDIEVRINKLEEKPNIIKKIKDKLYIHKEIMTELNLNRILEAVDVQEDDKLVFIVDNFGSVIGQEDDVFRKQNEFIKELDTICKRNGWHALALTQIVKDNNFKLFDKDGNFVTNITNSIMSGSIMLGNLSRSVMLTGFNDNHQFKQKVLKRGSGLWHERGGNTDDYITVR